MPGNVWQRVLLVVVTSLTESAFALQPDLPLLPTMTAEGVIAAATDAAATDALATFDFSGTVALHNCSGGFFRFDQASDDDAGLVLTNGHCVDINLLGPGKVLVDLPSRRHFTFLARDGSDLGSIPAQRLLYATMTKTDLAVFALNATYRHIRDSLGVEALTLSPYQVPTGTAIEILSGFHKIGYTCTVDGIVPSLREANWQWFESIRYGGTGCYLKPGTSGAPIVIAGTRAIVGVNNTSNEGASDCSLNNPCEVAANGSVTSRPKTSYGQQTAWLYSCLDAEGQLDLEAESCQLPKPS